MFDTSVFRNIKGVEDFAREAEEFELRKQQALLQKQMGDMRLQQAQGQRQFADYVAQNPNQDIGTILQQQAAMTGDPSGYVDYMSGKEMLDMKNKAALELAQRKQAISGGGVSAYMKDAERLQELYPDMDLLTTYGLSRGGIGQGTYYNPEMGKVEALPGFAAARGGIKESESAGKARGTPLGEAQAEFADLSASYPGLRDATNKLASLAQVATYTSAGRFTDDVRRQLGVNVGNAAEAAAEMTTIIDTEVLPLLKPTFGAAFTVNEGEWLRATMGDPNLSPEEKIAQINARVQSWNRRLQTLARRTGEQIQPDVQNLMNLPVGASTGDPQLEGSDLEETIFNARKALKNGKNPDMVRQRLLDSGIDPARAGL